VLAGVVALAVVGRVLAPGVLDAPVVVGSHAGRHRHPDGGGVGGAVVEVVGAATAPLTDPAAGCPEPAPGAAPVQGRAAERAVASDPPTGWTRRALTLAVTVVVPESERHMRIVQWGSAAVAASSLLLLSACGSDDAAAPGSSASASSSTDGVSVVASTNVYGDIVSAIAGDDVEVTSIISDPSADPHSYEADTRTQLAVSDADLIIANGGGYDDFVGTLVDASGSSAPVIDVVELSGREAEAEAAGEELNEHMWYDFETVLTLSDEIVSSLSEIDPDNADDYEANGADFAEAVQGLIDSEAEQQPSTSGAGVAITEPVPGYLLDALGAENRTPEEFSEAIEEGGDIAPAVLQETLDLFTSGQVKALVYNEQTTGPETEQVLSAAEAAGVAVVPVTETLPDGEDYVSWMQNNLDAVSAALSA